MIGNKFKKSLLMLLFLSMASFLINVSRMWVLDTSFIWTDLYDPHNMNIIIKKTDTRRPCRVVVENKVDYHHEVIESAVLRYPLPWHKFNCTLSQPIIYDFALYQNRFHLKIAAAATALSKNARYLNETEFWGWKKYFESSLQYMVFDRNDGSGVQTKAYFNDLVLYEDLIDTPVDAHIDISCDIGTTFIQWLQRVNNTFCVLHGGDNQGLLSQWPQAYNRSCFLSPMWPENQCKFIAADLPKFDKKDGNDTERNATNIKICLQGSDRNLTLASEMFSKISYQQYNATLHISGRYKNHEVDQVRRLFDLGSHLTFSDGEKDFIRYHKLLTLCDIVLPLRDYPQVYKKSTGIVPSLIAYNLPAVVHMEFAKVYQHELTAPWEEYDDTIDSKVNALKKMVARVYEKKSGIQT